MALPIPQPGPSHAGNPDLDWSQVRETVLMLNVAVAQIETSLLNGDESVNTLANSFTSMVANAEMIGMAAENLPDNAEKETIVNNCNQVAEKMRAAIMAFQFYDKLTQRLTHLSSSLAVLGELVQKPEQLYNPYAWRGMQEKIKSKYTVESDKAMFEAILNGRSVEEALALARHCETESAQDDDLEFF